MGNSKGKNKGKGRGKKRSHSPKENKVATKVQSMSEVKVDDKHHCLKKRPTHVRTPRCIRLGHVVQCPIHTDSYPRRLSECVPCNSADRRLVQQERKDKGK
ncbi:hypothetical protein N7471_008603 [Penicillium samsonianum]|uniref:uncharacterized protein n=1 Tax=Penicillium samsonianum TaxID=1882272 RepID=UPI002549716C|nr:uncharacterized protein N7471_008603 [Penicillium samsonianum]KAJ6133388.1 hypothetical protein N7471_008603 [Penicillium samsonianum]